MRKIILTCILSIFVLTTQAQILNVDQPETYLPAELAKIKLGMGIADFQIVLDTAKMERNSINGYYYIQFKLAGLSNIISNVSFKFDAPQNGINLNRPLYELELEFVDNQAADDFLTQHFTSMYRITEKADKEWFLSTDKGYWVIISKTANKVVIAATIDGTERGFK